MATFKRCDECGKDLPAWGAISIAQTSPHGNVSFSFTGVSGNNPADLCDWQCVGRYAAKRAANTGQTVTYN